MEWEKELGLRRLNRPRPRLRLDRQSTVDSLIGSERRREAMKNHEAVQRRATDDAILFHPASDHVQQEGEWRPGESSGEASRPPEEDEHVEVASQSVRAILAAGRGGGLQRGLAMGTVVPVASSLVPKTPFGAGEPGAAEERLPRKARFVIIIVAVFLLLTSFVLVGVTLRMAPVIDQMVRKENEELLRMQGNSSSSRENATTVDRG